MLPGRLGERAEQPLELRLAGIQLIELGQQGHDLELGADGPVGELVAAGDMRPHGRPEAGQLDLLVLGLLGDQLLGHDLAQHELILGGTRGCGRTLLELG